MNKVTPRIAAEIASHEAVIRECYKDSKGIWTWGFGVTNQSGHQVYPRYKDNPASLEKCIEVFIWLLQKQYAPDVFKALGNNLTENQLGGALSFHWNTGGILRASWAKHWKADDVDIAYKKIMDWNKPREILGRRQKERDLFFDGKWSSDGTCLEMGVYKPSYSPKWSTAKRIRLTFEESNES